MKTRTTIFGDIGGNGVTADAIRSELARLDEGTGLLVEINSEGGSVAEAVAIYNLLKAWRGSVEVEIVGWALSSATVIAMAGDTIRAHKTSLLMVHAPWLSAAGNAAQLREHAEVLDRVADTMRDAYRRTLQPDHVVTSWLAGTDHWFTADEARAAGLVDEVVDAEETTTAPLALAKCRFPVPSRILERIVPMTEIPLTHEQIRAEALRVDSERRHEIRMRFNAFANRDGVRDLMTRCEDDPGISADAACARLMAHLGRDAEPLNPPGSYARISTADHRAGDFRAAAEDVLLARAGIRVDDPHPAARDLQRMGVVAMAERFLSMAGRSCGSMSRGEVVQAAMTTTDFPVLLSNLTGRSLRAGYEQAPATHAVWTGEREVPDFKQQTLAQLSEAPNLELVIEGGEFTFGAFNEAAEKFSVRTYGKIIRFTRQALINDDLGALTNIPAAQGAAARRLEADLVYGKLITSPELADGKALFHSDHGNLASGAALSVASLGVARAMMRAQRGLNGTDYLDPQPRFLIVPVALETAAEQLIASIVDPAGTNDTVNPAWIRRLTLVADPRLDDDSQTAWYLAAAPTQIEGIVRAYLTGEPRPFLDDKEGWVIDSVDFKVRLDVGVGVIDYRGLLKNPGQ